jgi:hypothetical protein
MLWGLLELEGHDPSVMSRSLKPLLTTPDALVHDRGLYPVPTLEHLSPELRSAALTSPEWLRVTVLRNPFKRLYSAWESKVLLGAPGNPRFRGAPELVTGEKGIDVGASFRSFVRALVEHPEQWMYERHFCRQVDLIPEAMIDTIEYVPTGSIPDLFVRLSDRAGRVVTPRRSNEGLGIDGAALLDDEGAEQVAQLYAADLALTGAEPAACTSDRPVYLDPAAVALLRLAGARSDRTVLLHRSYQQTPEQRLGNAARRVVRKLKSVPVRT